MDLIEHTLATGDFLESTANTLAPGMLVTDLAGIDLGDQAGVVMKSESQEDGYVVWLWMTDSEEVRKFKLPKDTAYQAKEPPPGMDNPEPYDTDALEEMGDLPSIRTLPESYWPDDPNYESPLTTTLWRPTFRRYPYYRYYSKEDEMKRIAEAEDVARTIKPLLEADLEKYDSLFDSEAGDYYAREFDRWVDSWAIIIGDEVWKAEVVRQDGDVSALNYTDVARELAKILFKMEEGDKSMDDFYNDLKDLEDEAVDVAFDAASKSARAASTSDRTAADNAIDAFKIDCKGDGFYGDYDEDHGYHYVFGSETGFAYSEHQSMEEAEKEAEEMNQRCEKKKKVSRTAADNSRDAFKIDCKGDGFYGDYDEDHGYHYVFGAETSFAYSEHPTMEDAEAEAERMNQRCEKSRTAAKYLYELPLKQQEHLEELYRDMGYAESHYFKGQKLDLSREELKQLEQDWDATKAEYKKYMHKYFGKQARTAAMEWPSTRKVNYPTPDTTNPTFTDDGEWVDDKTPLQKAFPKTKDYPPEMERAADGFWEDYQMFKIRKIPGVSHSNESLDAHKYAFMWARNNEYDLPQMRELMDYMSKIGLFPQSTYDAWDQMVSYDAMLPHMHNDTA